MSQEPHELHERAERGREDTTLAPVTITMAILAVLVATVSLLGHRAHTEELLQQTKATDHWAYYQAKNIRRENIEGMLDLLSMVEVKNTEGAAHIKEKYRREIDRDKAEQK